MAVLANKIGLITARKTHFQIGCKAFVKHFSIGNISQIIPGIAVRLMQLGKESSCRSDKLMPMPDFAIATREEESLPH